MPGELCLQFDSNDSVATSHIDMTVTKESIILFPIIQRCLSSGKGC